MIEFGYIVETVAAWPVSTAVIAIGLLSLRALTRLVLGIVALCRAEKADIPEVAKALFQRRDR